MHILIGDVDGIDFKSCVSSLNIRTVDRSVDPDEATSI